MTDEDIEGIIQQDEAGVGDLLEAYGPAEQAYMAAATQAAPGDAYSSVSWASGESTIVDSAR